MKKLKELLQSLVGVVKVVKSSWPVLLAGFLGWRVGAESSGNPLDGGYDAILDVLKALVAM